MCRWQNGWLFVQQITAGIGSAPTAMMTTSILATEVLKAAQNVTGSIMGGGAGGVDKKGLHSTGEERFSFTFIHLGKNRWRHHSHTSLSVAICWCQLSRSQSRHAQRPSDGEIQVHSGRVGIFQCSCLTETDPLVWWIFTIWGSIGESYDLFVLDICTGGRKDAPINKAVCCHPMHHSHRAFSIKKQKKKKQLTFMSSIMFWHTHKKKSGLNYCIYSMDVCPLKSRKAVILFWPLKGNMMMSHDSVRVSGRMADRQVFLFLVCLFPGLVLPLNNSCFSGHVLLLGMRRCSIPAWNGGAGGLRVWRWRSCTH